MDYNNLLPHQEVDENGLVFELESLYAYLAKVKDPRDKRGKQYSLVTLLVLMVLAKLGGEDTPTGITDWVTGRRELLMELKVLNRAKAPCHMTYRRVLQEILDSVKLEVLMREYHQLTQLK